MFLAFVFSLFSINWGPDLLHSGGKATIIQIVKAFFNPELSSDIINLAIKSTWLTLSYAVAGMSLAVVIALVFGILAFGAAFKNVGLGIALGVAFGAGMETIKSKKNKNNH